MKERGGDIIFGEGQVFLIAERTDPTTGEIERLIRHPIAIVSPAEPASEGKYGRWRYDAKVFVALPGAAIRPVAFEFLTPPDAKPVSIFVKGIRVDLDATDSRDYATTQSRDAAIAAGSLLPSGASATPLDSSASQSIGNNRGGDSNSDAIRDAGVVVGPRLPLRMQLQKGNVGTITLDEDNKIISGESKLTKEQVQTRGLSKELRINSFGLRKGTNLIQIEVSQDKPGSLLGRSVAAAERVLPPVVVDTNGTQYRAIGWVYQDRDGGAYVRYTPDRPIRGLSELQSRGVSLTRSRPDQKLVLLFEVTENVEIESFGIGGKEVIRFETPIEVGKIRGRR